MASPAVARAETAHILTSSFSSASANLDLIRAFAVLAVFFGHLHGIVTREASITAWHLAQIGVLTFFVHTSFVLMLSLERTPADSMFRHFYTRRAFRIYPLAVVCVLLAFLLQKSPQGGNRVWTIPELAANLTLTTNLTYSENMVGGLWTLPLEVQMYVCLPFLFLIGRAKGTAAVAVLWIASVPLALAQVLLGVDRLSVVGYAPCFIAGVLGWSLSTRACRVLPGWLWPFTFAASFSIFFAAKHETHMYFRWLFCVVLGLALPWFREVQWRPLNRVAAVIAKYSYGIYLSHIAVMRWCSDANWWLFPLVAAAAPIAAYHLVEAPMVRMGQQLVSLYTARHTYSSSRSVLNSSVIQ